MVALIATTVSIVLLRLSLPLWSVETEGRWPAYGLLMWAFLVGERPLRLALVRGDLLLWPHRPRGLAARGLGVIALIIAVAGLVALAGIIYGLLHNALILFQPRFMRCSCL